MNLRRGGRLALAVFLLTWIPLSVWRGLALGRTFRFGPEGRGHWGPLADAIINVGAAMFAPAALAALVVFVLWAWREERRHERRVREGRPR